MVHDIGGGRPRHDQNRFGSRKTGCDNEISLVSRLIARGATISITSAVHDDPIEGVIVWSDLNNICLRTGALARVFSKRHIADWSFGAANLDG
jgi:hypothetical protein